MKFKYSKYRIIPSQAFPKLTEIWRPTIPVRLTYLNKTYGCIALVDSGADFCIFHAVIGELLNINIKSGKTSPLHGATSGIGKVYYHNISIDVGGWSVNSYIGFSYDLTYPFPLLGQVGFFDRFKVSFDYKKKDIDINPKTK